MNIKHIPKFRSDWKTEQGYPEDGWDADFLGSVHGETNGFYKMVNGIVHDIRADLIPKLQNAQDEQAIYEFLQNAADAGADDCAVIYDQDFFMVLNTGRPFSEKDIKAVLNSFQGTKADKTRPENCHKIGRYGIGFKLAHRLVGKSDGVDELLNDMAGPILFSWFNQKQFNSVIHRKEGSAPSPVDDRNSPSAAPWLLKIVLSCFPAMPGEEVKNLDYKKQIVFPPHELDELTAFLNRHSHVLQELDLSEGSVFFLKFGQKKREKLEASILNLRSGIGYSLNTLKTLSRVVLNNEVIEEYDLELENFELLPGEEAFKKIDPEFPYCPIQIAFGFHKDEKAGYKLKEAPNLYQYFPMRNEKHSLAFLIHATSFSKVTDRTRLDDQGEANLETLRYLVDALETRMKDYQRSNFERFARIYQAILLSDHSGNGTLINENLYEPLLQLIRSQIPTQKGNCYPKDVVVLKGTRLPVEPIHFGIGKEWFYWSDDNHSRTIQQEAAKVKKLNLKTWTLIDLLKEGNPELISNWIPGLNADEYAIFVEELKEGATDKKIQETIRSIPAFRFANASGKGKFYTLEDILQSPDTFLADHRSAEIQDILRQLGFSVLLFDLDSFSEILGQDPALAYLFRDQELFKKIAAKTPDNSLSLKQRNKLWTFLSGLSDLKPDDLRTLALFPDKHGKVKAFSALLPSGIGDQKWLADFVIDQVEDQESVSSLLTPRDRIFSQFIIPCWQELTSNPKVLEDVGAFYEAVLEFHGRDRRKAPLGDLDWIYLDAENGFVGDSKVWYHRDQADFEGYHLADEVLENVLELRLPNPELLPFIGQGPFRLRTINTRPDWRNIQQQLIDPSAFEGLPYFSRIAVFDLLVQGSWPEKQLAQLPLFQNKRGEISSPDQMIAPTVDCPSWLAGHQIQSGEFREDLDQYLLEESGVYMCVILRKWDKFITSEVVLKDPGVFYEGVRHYFELARTTTKLQGLNYVFIDEDNGFVGGKYTFYHPSLSEAEDYSSLRSAIGLCTGLQIPDPFILPYLSEDPYKTNISRFIPLLKGDEYELTEEEVRSLIQLSDLVQESLFKHFIIEEKQDKNTFQLKKKGRFTQVYLGGKRSKTYQQLSAHLPGKYRILPPAFYSDELLENGVIGGQKLLQTLIREVDPGILGELAESEEADPRLQTEYVQQLDELILEEGTQYDAGSMAVSFIQLFRKRDSNPDNLRDKIVLINSQGERFPLADYDFDDTLTFSPDRQQNFDIPLSEIVPDLKPVFELKTKLSDQFPEEERSLLEKKVLYSGNQISPAKAARLLQQKDSTLENGAQLAFAVLLGTESPMLTRNFRVKTREGVLCRLSDKKCWLLKPNPLFRADCILDKVYSSAAKFLGNKEEPFSFLKFGDQHLLSQVLLIGDEIKSPPLQQAETDQSLIEELVTLAFSLWKRSKPESLHWNELLAVFEGKPYAWVFPDEWAQELERVPAFLQNWMQEDLDKLAFLLALGVNSHDSDLVGFRKCLSEKESEYARKRFNQLVQDKHQAIQNSIRWAFENKIEFPFTGESTDWLRRSYDAIGNKQELPIPVLKTKNQKLVYHLKSEKVFHLSAAKLEMQANNFLMGMPELIRQLKQTGVFVSCIEFRNFPQPILNLNEEVDFSTLDNKAKEWEVNYYQEWKRERPFEIFLIDGEIPYIVTHQGEEVHRYEKGNILASEDRIYLNKQEENLEEILFSIAQKTVGLTYDHLSDLLRLKNKFGMALKDESSYKASIEHVIVVNEAPNEKQSVIAFKSFMKRRPEQLELADDNEKGPWFSAEKEGKAYKIFLVSFVPPEVILNYEDAMLLDGELARLAIYDGANVRLLTLEKAITQTHKPKINIRLNKTAWELIKKKSDLPEKV